MTTFASDVLLLDAAHRESDDLRALCDQLTRRVQELEATTVPVAALDALADGWRARAGAARDQCEYFGAECIWQCREELTALTVEYATKGGGQ